jgi:hypothetical protein
LFVQTNVEPSHVAPDFAVTPEVQTPAQAARRAPLRGLIVAAVVLAFCALMFFLKWLAPGGSSLDVFWGPVFASKTAPVILLAHHIVYQPSTHASQLDRQRNGVPVPPAQRVIHLPANLLDGSDYVPAMDQFVGFGDAEAALRISSVFVQHRQSPAVRLASRVDFYDLREARVTLIGAFTNHWTMELTKGMKFRFGYTNGMPCIEDSTKGCRWTLTTKSDNGKSNEDYILVARLPHSVTSGFTVIAAGLNVYGTEEAGRILSDPESFNAIARHLPSHWPDQNMELVLHVSVLGDAPAQSEVVSVYTW